MLFRELLDAIGWRFPASCSQQTLSVSENMWTVYPILIFKRAVQYSEYCWHFPWTYSLHFALGPRSCEMWGGWNHLSIAFKNKQICWPFFLSHNTVAQCWTRKLQFLSELEKTNEINALQIFGNLPHSFLTEICPGDGCDDRPSVSMNNWTGMIHVFNNISDVINI